MQKLEKAETFKVSLTKDELAQIKFSAITGDVSVVAKYEKGLAGILGEVDKNLNLDRKYFVGGKETNSFKETDLVEVRLYPQMGKAALSGHYQLTDLLPSGLRLVSAPYQWGQEYGCEYGHPYEVDGNRLKFRLYEGWGKYCGAIYLKYYARVVSTGQYAAEPATIQSFKSLQSKNYSPAGVITISQ